MGMSESGASYMVLDIGDMEVLEKVAQRIIDARGQEYSYKTTAGVLVTFTPPAQPNAGQEATNG